MKIKDMLDKVNRLKENTIDDADKFEWINELEGIVFNKVFAMAEDTDFTFTPNEYDVDIENELLIPVPYTDTYFHFLCAKIDEVNGEFTSYNNSMTLYNNMYEAFAIQYRRNHVPKQPATMGGY